ncbi:transporter substrate-binding domain-containing protein [Phytoactinopolyspora limicola]|uniref:transporter substrate-binding domain-containing protein n=1 Tax=Phytoactinopolyspora limicola TaxID=2715536 RepID=UPI0014084649|nr:transporter substrate-binding domain-containing protein [Phytoactinopolyspora limicola]
MSRARPRSRLCIIGLLLTVAVTACSADDDTPDPAPDATASGPAATPAVPEPADVTPEPTPDTYGSLASLLPDNFDATTIALGVPPEDMRSPRYLDVADDTVDGALPDLVRAAADLLGLDTKPHDFEQGDELNEAYLDGLPAVYLLVASPRNFPVDHADMVGFTQYENRFLLAGGVSIGDDPADLCGLEIGRYDGEHASRGSAGYLAEIEGLCQANGDPIELVTYTPGEDDTIDEVIAGNVDAIPAGELAGITTIDEHPELDWGGPLTGLSTSTFIVGQDHGLADALAAAIDELATSGQYAQIMDRHGLPSLPPPEPLVNVVED